MADNQKRGGAGGVSGASGMGGVGALGIYLQVPDLDRSVAFYSNCLGLGVDWNDGALAVLRGPGQSSDSIVLRQVDEEPMTRHELGESGVSRIFWRVDSQEDLDAAERVLTDRGTPYQRHRDPEIDGVTTRDPDGLHVVLIWSRQKPGSGAPPAWLYWYR